MRIQKMRPYRVWTRFSSNDGALLAGGMAYQSVFALFAAIWVGFSIAGLWLRENQQVFGQLAALLDGAVPGLISTGGSSGLITEKSLDQAHIALNITGLVAAASLLWTAIGWLASTRTAVRTMFDLGPDTMNFLLLKLRDFGLAALFAIGLVLSALVSLVSIQLLHVAADWIGLSQHSFWFGAGAKALSDAFVLLLNFATLASMYRILSRVAIPWHNLIVGAGIGAVALTLMSTASGYLLRGASKNPLLGSFVVFVGLLIWFYLVCQVILFCASWIAIGMQDRGLSPQRMSEDDLAQERLVVAHRLQLQNAHAEVAAARHEVDAARGLRRARARRRLERAYRYLGAVQADEPSGTR